MIMDSSSPRTITPARRSRRNAASATASNDRKMNCTPTAVITDELEPVGAVVEENNNVKHAVIANDYGSNGTSRIHRAMTEHSSSDDEASVNQYIANCTKFGVPIDPGVVIALRTRWNILQPTTAFSEGAMLPLMGVLEHRHHIRSLKLASAAMITNRYAGNGNSNARALNAILSAEGSMRGLEELDLSDTGIDDDGILEVCDIVRHDRSRIRSLNLSSNHFGSRGVEELLAALNANPSSAIRHLDVSRNALGFQSINLLECNCTSVRSMRLVKHGNFVFEEILNSVSHGIAFLFSIVAANILIAEAGKTHRTDYHYWACVVYSFNASLMFLCSTLFHSFFMMPETSKILQILDHVGIYFQIAGSYTPLLLIGLHYSYEARVLLIIEWSIAVCGAVFSTVAGDMNNTATNNVEMVIFLLMGAGVFTVWPAFQENIAVPALVLLALGVLAYVVGIAFFIMGESRQPIYHSVWHVLVFVAATLHWFAIYFYIVPTDLAYGTVPLIKPLD